MPTAQPKTPARQSHVSGDDHAEQSGVSAELAESTTAHTSEKSGSTPTIRCSKCLRKPNIRLRDYD